MSTVRRVFLVQLAALFVSCGGKAPAERSDGDADARPAGEERREPPEELGEKVERHVGDAADAVRHAGERAEAGANEAADAIDRAGNRAHAGLDQAKASGDDAKRAFVTQARRDLAQLDDELRALEADGKTASDSAVVELRAARDRMQQRIDELDKQTGDAWKDTKTEVEQAIAKLRADIEARRAS